MGKSQSFTFSVPKQTPQSIPFQQTVLLWLPVVQSISVQIPEGHKNFSNMEIWTAGYLLMSDIHGDKQVKESGRLDVIMFGPPYYITFRGWNVDDFLPHEFIVEVFTREA